MREKWPAWIEPFRVKDGKYASGVGDRYGLFQLKKPPMVKAIVVLVSDGLGWKEMGLPGTPFEHVSVSLADRTPTWAEMCWVKEIFWDDTECVMQLHPPKADWVNRHDFTLHLWAPIGVEIPRPPKECV